MPIKMMQTGRGAGPVVICDYCGECVERAKEANYEWVTEDYTPGSLSNTYFLHKRCSQAHEQMMETHLSSDEMLLLVPFLKDNLDVDLEDAQKLAEFVSQDFE